MLMSAWGRRVRVGLSVEEEGVGVGVMEERKRGHSDMAFESVLRRMGRYVSLVNWAEEGGSDGVGWA